MLEEQLSRCESLLHKEQEAHEVTRRSRSEVEDLLKKDRDAHLAKLSKLQEEKIKFAEEKYNDGLRAGRILEAEANRSKASVESDSEDEDRQFEMNTCINLRWIIERFDEGLYDIEVIRQFLLHKIQSHNFNPSIATVHIEADEDEKSFCEGLLASIGAETKSAEVSDLDREREARLRRSFVNMVLEGEKEKKSELANIYVKTLAEVNMEEELEKMTPEQLRKAVIAFLERKVAELSQKVDEPAATELPEGGDDAVLDKHIPVTLTEVKEAAKAEEDRVFNIISRVMYEQITKNDAEEAAKEKDDTAEADKPVDPE